MDTSTVNNWHLRSCPRCNGDLYRDIYAQDNDLVCLQCGRTYPLSRLEGYTTQNTDFGAEALEGNESASPAKRRRVRSK